ncbi:MAG TPA: M17 family peptidase N-terminal domain-containing protein [bacterium]|nr:M17 family peptidase N-terminal domain-containing protein [bacterium]
MKLKATSQEIDLIETDTVVLSFFENERPLKGAVGLTDWRMCGRLSRLIMHKWIDGEYGEPLLMPANHRMNSEKVLVVGLGLFDQYDMNRYKQMVDKICETLMKIQVNRFALPLPGVELAQLDPAEAAEFLGKALQRVYGPKADLLRGLEVVVVAPGPDLKRINPVLARLERSNRA